MDRRRLVENPYRPGAGHRPPYLAGREFEKEQFSRLLRQGFVNENILITGQRGFGKTVLVADFRSIAEQAGWIWVGNDLSETSTLTEERLALRILTDTSEAISRVLGRGPEAVALEADDMPVTFEALKALYERSPGLVVDRLKSVLVRLGSLVRRAKASGIILAYDEAQCLSDHAERDEFPMSLLIELVATLQKKDGIAPFLLVLSGLPGVHDSLIETRTYTERMFRVMTLARLSRQETESAILQPLQENLRSLPLSQELVDKAIDMSGGYPYLVQFFARELFDQVMQSGGVLRAADFPSADAMDRLDAGLFSARWNKTSDRQRAVLKVIATQLGSIGKDFSAQEIVDASLPQDRMSNAQVSQHLQALCDRGILYRTRHGRYGFTVPMSEHMILRRLRAQEDEALWNSTVLAGRRVIATPPSLPVGERPVEVNGNGARWKWFRS